MIDWQPIETARKDIGPVLLWQPAEDYLELEACAVVAIWREDWEEWQVEAYDAFRVLRATHWAEINPPQPLTKDC